MLPKENRLKKKKDFEKVFEKGETIKGDSVYIKALKTKEPFTRIGFIVSKKVSLNAVERNKIKRRIREIVKTIPIKNKFDIVIVSLSKIKKNTFEEIKQDIEKTFKKINNA